MINTHELSVKLENVFRTSVKEDFAIHCSSDFEGDNLYNAIIFWLGVSVGNFIARNALPIDSPIAANIKDDFWMLQDELKRYDGLSWENIDEPERNIIEKVREFVKSLND